MSKTYKQDNMTIHNADCMEVMKQYEDNYFDLAVVDPPYRDTNQPTKQMREKQKGNMRNFGNKPNAKYFKELFRISKDQIIWGGNNFIDDLYSTNCFIFWDKLNELDNYSDGELAWTSFNKIAKQIRYMWSGNRYGYPNSIKGVGKPSCRVHPTEKPRDLYTWIYANYAKEGQKILDTHLGSGSNAIAAHYAKMHFVGCELDEDYYKAAVERIRKETRQQEFNFDDNGGI